MFQNSSILRTLASRLVTSLILLGAVATADEPLWWSQPDNDGHVAINPAITNADPKAVANIGQAKFMAKRALEAMRQFMPETADEVESKLVGAGKIIPTWDPPAVGSPLAKEQFAPLLIGQLKALADPFYTALRDADSEWVLAQMAENGTIDLADPDNFFPWTSDGADNADKAIATIGQLKGVFSLRFESIPLTLTAEDMGVPDEDVDFDVNSGNVQYIPLAGLQSAPFAENSFSPSYEIQFRKGSVFQKKFGYKLFRGNQDNRYLSKRRDIKLADLNGNRIFGSEWVVGTNYYARKDISYLSTIHRKKDTIHPVTGVVTDAGLFVYGPYHPILTGSPISMINNWNFEKHEDDWEYPTYRGFWYAKYLDGGSTYSYDLPPYTNYFDGPVSLFYEESLEDENTIEMVKQTALANPPAYPDVWTNGKPWATWGVSSDNLGVTYSRFIFRFRKKDVTTNSPPVSAGVYFTPKGSSVKQLLKTVSWNGIKVRTDYCTVDPKALRRGLEGDFHIGFASIYFEMDIAKQNQREAGEAVIIPANETDSGGGNAPDTATPVVRFPGMDDSWYTGATITLTKASGAGAVRFKVGTTEVPLGSNLAPQFFNSGGQHSGGHWKIEGVTAGPVKMILTYTKGTTTMSATRMATVIRGDLDMDSDNSGAIASTDAGKIAEENIENDLTKSGKIIAVSPDSLNDADGVPNSVDGLAELRINASGFKSSDLIKFSYFGSNPAGTQSTTNGGVVSYQNAAGALRIWKKPVGGGPPVLSDYVAPATYYSLADLGLGSNTEQWLYVQGVSPSLLKTYISVEMSSNGVVVEDTVVATALPIDILEVISDQISGNEANKLPTAHFGGQPNNPMVMGTRTGADARLMVKMNVSSAYASAVRVGVRKNGTAAILNSAPCLAAPAKTPLSFTALVGSETYEIVAGYDADSNGMLNPEEVTVVFQKTPKTNTPESGGGAYIGAHWNLVDKFIVVTQVDFVSARSATEGYSGLPYSLALPNSSKLIGAFATGSKSIPGTDPTTFGNYITANGIGTPTSRGLSLPLGAKWDSANEASTHLFDFPDGSDLSEQIKASNTIKLLLSRLISSNKSEILASAQTGYWVTHTLIDVKDENVDFSADPLTDMYYSLKKCKFQGNLEVEMTAVSGGFNVRYVKLSGVFIDLYDFAWPGGIVKHLGVTLDIGNATRAQAGHATLTAAPHSDAGRVFYTRVATFNVGKDFFGTF